MAEDQHNKKEHGMASTGDEEIKKIGIIGCGSMGGNMALLFAEKGLEVVLSDPSQDSIDTVLQQAKQDGLSERVQEAKDYAALAEALPSPRVLLFSLPHGTVGDDVLHKLEPYLRPGDIILDAGNENYENTQRRQGQCTTRGINYVGMGVSGGYQAARRGPSMCPGGDVHTLRPNGPVMRLLRKVAAKEGGNDTDGAACVGYAGFGGAGHYVKCLHNGIEHGMMSAVAEAYDLMAKGLKMSLEEMGDEFERWNTHKDSPLRNTFLVAIAADICRAKDPEQDNAPVLPTVLDKVVQDLTGEEGTGVWSSMEAVRLHVPAPTLTTAHYLRIASAFRGRREATSMLFRDGTGVVSPPSPLQKLDTPAQRRHFLDQLLDATYTACLGAYVQGINVIEEANREQGWHVDYAAVWQIWRAGCIIQSEHISAMLAPIFKRHHEPSSAKATDGEPLNMLRWPAIINELAFGYQALKRVVLASTQHDFVTPALSATLEWIKYSGAKDLPTRFSEAQLDYFGKHMYDRKSESKEVPGPTEGRHHFEWKKA